MSLRLFRHVLMLFLAVFVLISAANIVRAGCYIVGDPENRCVDSITPIPGALVLSPGASCQSFPTNCARGCCCFYDSGNPVSLYDVARDSCIGLNKTSPTFYDSITTQAECTPLCQGAVPLYSVSGYILNDSHALVQNANVYTINNNVYSTGPDGYYQFNHIPTPNGVSLVITANKSECVGSISIPQFTSDYTNQNITLTCCTRQEFQWSNCSTATGNRTRTVVTRCPGKPDNVTSESESCNLQVPCEWNCTWSDCDNVTNMRQSICNLQPNGCVNPPVRPPFFEKCAIPTDQCNHNGILDNPSEECDMSFTAPFGFESRCTPYNTTAYCNLAICKCINATIIPPECEIDPGKLDSLSIFHVAAMHAFRLNWTFEPKCLDYIKNFELSRCNNATGTCNFVMLNNNIPKSSRAYFDNATVPPIIANKKHCYMLTAVFNDSIPFGLRRQSIVECKDAGDEECMNPHPDKWCGLDPATKYNAVLQCDDNNALTIAACSGPDYFCSITGAGALCIPQGPCDRCNNIFGLFGYQLLTSDKISVNVNDDGVYDPNGLNTKIMDCPTLLNPAPSDPDKLLGCYLDYTRTAVDKSYPCSDVQSCYDYKSPGACTNDYCQKFNFSNNQCEWMPYNTEYNKGVCRPKKEFLTEQNCTLCNVQSYNRIYPTCSGDTCNLYGYCFFNSAAPGSGPDAQRCIDGSGMACNYYKTQDDCIGIGGLASNVLVNVTWNPGLSFKIGGDNALLNPSHDTMDIGRCRWIGVSPQNPYPCIKDADNNNVDDCNDILGQANRSECQHDTTPPVTIINNRPAYAMMMDLSGIVVSDDGPWLLGDYSSAFASKNSIKMHYCIAPIGGQACYPTSTLNTTVGSGNRYIVDTQAFKNKNGQYINSMNSNGYGFSFYYFSEDPSKNLEKVRKFDFQLDTEPPQVRLSTNYNSFKDYGTVWRTNLTFAITLLKENTLPVECAFNLRPSASSRIDFTGMDSYDIARDKYPYKTLLSSVGGMLNTTYPYLLDSHYDYNLSCTDGAGNVVEEFGTLTVEGDMRINSATPFEGTFRSVSGFGVLSAPQNMSINTSYNGNCRYSSSTYLYQNMTRSFTKYSTSVPNNYFHVTPLALNGIDPSGIYRYYTSCNLTINGMPQVVAGDDVDAIYFAIDDLAPKTSVMYATDADNMASYIYDPKTSSETLAIKLLCNDSYNQLAEKYIMSNGELYYRDLSFGCNQTYYCMQRADNPGSCNDISNMANWQAYDGSTISFDYTNESMSEDKAKYGNAPSICYYSVDNGFNSEASGGVQCTRLNVRNGKFNTPIINITVGD